MNLSKLSDVELVLLIRDASAELYARSQSAEIDRVKFPERPRVAIREPSDDDMDFALRIKAGLQSGEYIKAAARQRVAKIAEEFPEWIARQRLPSSAGAGEWARAGGFLSAERAKAR